MGSDNKIDLAICGLGNFAKKRILPALISCPNINLVAVVDQSMTKSEFLPDIKYFNSLGNLLRSNYADAVYIATPNYLHYPQTLLCLEAGRHVLCEKPMALSGKDCESMITIAQEFKLQLTVGHMLRCSPVLQEVRRLLQCGKLGALGSIRVGFYYDLPKNKRPWASRREFSGGGALMDGGVHCIDTVRFLIGDPVIALGARMDLNGPSGIEQIATCLFTAAGISGSLSVCSKAPYSSNLTVCGDDGEIVVDSFAACWDAVTLKYISYKDSSLNQEIMMNVSGTYSLQMQAFADAILSKNRDYKSAINAMGNINIIETFYQIANPF